MEIFDEILEKAEPTKGGLGAIVFTVLEGLRRGGASAEEIAQVEELCNQYFPNLSNELCNTLCRVTESRLCSDKEREGIWYSQPVGNC